MDDIVIEKTGGLYWVEGGPIRIGEAFRTIEQALRFARREAGHTVAVILKGADQ